MAKPCTPYEERVTSACCIDMGSAWEEERGRPFGTWRRTVEDKMPESGRPGMNSDGLLRIK